MDFVSLQDQHIDSLIQLIYVIINIAFTSF